jgi:hypothetical protein
MIPGEDIILGKGSSFSSSSKGEQGKNGEGDELILSLFF